MAVPEEMLLDITRPLARPSGLVVWICATPFSGWHQIRTEEHSLLWILAACPSPVATTLPARGIGRLRTDLVLLTFGLAVVARAVHDAVPGVLAHQVAASALALEDAVAGPLAAEVTVTPGAVVLAVAQDVALAGVTRGTGARGVADARARGHR